MSLILPKSCLVPNAIFTSLFAQGHKAQWPPFSLSLPFIDSPNSKTNPVKSLPRASLRLLQNMAPPYTTAATATIPEIHGQGHPWSGTLELHRRMFAL